MKSIGICFGSSTLQIVELERSAEGITVRSTGRIIHEGDPGAAFVSYIRRIGTGARSRITVTGRTFRKNTYLSSITEPHAVEMALRYWYRDKQMPQAVISSGGETQLVYRITASGGIAGVHSGNKCASGSGEFFMQQIRRMGLTVGDAVELADAGTPSRIAGRCSVFCKSDCTHALNKGESKANVVAGLCRMMADKIADLVKDADCRHVTFIGGGSLNRALVRMLSSRFDTIDIPETADCFEAFGAALWALDNHCVPLPDDIEQVVVHAGSSFGTHRPLAEAVAQVDFKESVRAELQQGDECILGLDVGSTTTKAVLMRRYDAAVGASVYLRTGGDPILASRNCYRAIREQIEGKEIVITGLGVTGSGRQIAALHALTDDVINEIIAHATAAAHFDRDVDTIFEIGGQDAKYTYLTSGVPSDYAMNEACSAGTGSFLEEAARESLNVATEAIGDAALQGAHPANFTDQCAAFIGSDIKLAGQEGVSRDDILAGLVYSICLNYVNRVKGSRPVGKKIFMQGGVCYNKAVPLAMASLMKSPIIVPPEPGLMGAYGAALETAKRFANGESVPSAFDLDILINREAVRESGFECAGGREKCDRKCMISRIRLDGRVYPFGGACNRYYNDRINRQVSTGELDLVAVREHLLLHEYGVEPSAEEGQTARTIGIMRSFLTHSLYPLYSQFFARLGFSIIQADHEDREGIAYTESAFCLPAEIAHASFYNLLKRKPAFIFLPHVMQVPVPNVPTYSRACPFVQGEPYFLPATFRREITECGCRILSPVLKMDSSYEAARSAVVEMAQSMGVDEKSADEAWKFACEKQRDFEKRLREVGQQAVEKLAEDPSALGVVLFGRPYNALTGDGNMGIPHKIASRGITVIPFDMLPADDYQVNHKMFWAMGQKILKAAQYVKKTPNLFGCFITNFSCGPDSFVIGYFRNIMKEKPSLTLELDQHTADAGIDTRVEAALTIMTTYFNRKAPPPRVSSFRPARVINDTSLQVISSQGRRLPLTHPDVEVILPSMGKYVTESIAAVLRSAGINARALPVSDKEILLTGRANTSCKECLPYILTTGSFLQYIEDRKDSWKVTLFFMATGGGPCRLGQYAVALEQLIEQRQIENAAVLTITDENGYGGLGNRILLRSWQAIVLSDVFTDIRSMLAVTAKDRDAAFEEMERLWREVVIWCEGRLSLRFSTFISSIAARLRRIPLAVKPSSVPVISLIGEIYVRRDEFSRKDIAAYLEKQGFMVRIAPVAEYLCYSNYVINSGLGERQFTFGENIKMQLVARIQEWWESRIKSIMAQSGLYHFEMIEIDKTVEGVSHLVNRNMRGETVLTVGLGMREILDDSCGVIAIGPFGCMPSRISEAILKKEMTPEGKARISGWSKRAVQFSELGTFPFLSIETDGAPFPPLVEANLEAFVLQAGRLHRKMQELHKGRERRRAWKHLPVAFYEMVLGNRMVAKKEKK